MERIKLSVAPRAPVGMSLKTGAPTKLSLATGGARVIGDYEQLTNKPSINAVELVGNKTFEELGDNPLTNTEIQAIFNRVF